MKHLKRFNESNKDPFIQEYLNDIALELSDIGFSVNIQEPNMRNFSRYDINIIYSPGESASQFKLGDIKDVVCTMTDYMLSNNYFIDAVDISGPSFKDFRKIEGDFKDPHNWDDNQELVLIHIYFDCDL